MYSIYCVDEKWTNCEFLGTCAELLGRVGGRFAQMLRAIEDEEEPQEGDTNKPLATAEGQQAAALAPSEPNGGAVRCAAANGSSEKAGGEKEKHSSNDLSAAGGERTPHVDVDQLADEQSAAEASAADEASAKQQLLEDAPRTGEPVSNPNNTLTAAPVTANGGDSDLNSSSASVQPVTAAAGRVISEQR